MFLVHREAWAFISANSTTQGLGLVRPVSLAMASRRIVAVALIANLLSGLGQLFISWEGECLSFIGSVIIAVLKATWLGLRSCPALTRSQWGNERNFGWAWAANCPWHAMSGCRAQNADAHHRPPIKRQSAVSDCFKRPCRNMFVPRHRIHQVPYAGLDGKLVGGPIDWGLVAQSMEHGTSTVVWRLPRQQPSCSTAWASIRQIHSKFIEK